MAKFQDSKGREWIVSVTVGSMKRVRDVLGVNLGTVLQDNMKPLTELLEDPIQLVDVLYVLCKPQADADGITDVEFGESLCGDPFAEAVDAFLEGLIDFFPNRQGVILRKLVKKGQTTHAILAARAEKAIDEITEQTVIEQLSSLPGSSA